MQIGDKVQKTKGYKWPGVIVADFKTTKGDRRLVVESISEGTEGALHIYNEGQLEVVLETPAGVYAVAFEVPESSKEYITAGKLYKAIDDDYGFDAVMDSGNSCYLRWNDCCHLEGGNWTRVEIPA